MAGAGYKLFNTGDVLTAAQVNTYLMEQTVMVFADATARTTALSGVVAEGMLSYLKSTKQVEVYNGSAWVASDDPNAIQNTIVDAKGDLISASAADTPARLAVGNNGETLVADSSTSTGLRWQGNFAAGKQILLNSNFDIWQRGTSFASSGYMADRWQDGNSLGSITASQQTSGAPLGSRYYLRYTSTAGSSYKNLMQLLETTQTMQYWGKTLTFSILLRRNATANSGSVAVAIDKSVTNDASAAATWVNIALTNIALSAIPTGTTSSDWYTATVTATIPSDGTANSIRVHFYYNNAQASGSIIEMAQAQLEVGSLRTAFQTATGTLAQELMAAQRYYYKHPTGANNPLTNCAAYSTTNALGIIPFRVTMRTAPTMSVVTGTNYYQIVANGGVDNINSFTQDSANTDSATIYNNTEVAQTAGHAGIFISNNASASIAWSAEL